MERWISLFGLITMVAIAYSLSQQRRQISWRLVGWGLGLQITLGLLVLGVPALGFSGPLQGLFSGANRLINALLDFSLEGSRFIFGALVDNEELGFIFAFQVLPTIIFMSSLMAVFYHWGVMQRLVSAMAFGMQKLMGTSGAESLAAAANVFVGQTEAPLVVRPYIARMTQSELFTLMVGGMATVAGGVLAAYVGLLRHLIPDIAGHLLTASVMSAPAALVIAKIMLPETEVPETLGKTGRAKTQREQVNEADNSAKPTLESTNPSTLKAPQNLTHKDNDQKSAYRNSIEAAAAGASEGLKLALNVAAMLLAFIALVALVNSGLGQVGGWVGVELSLQLILGYLFAPLALVMGIPWSEILVAGGYLGEKIVLNEFVAYLNLAQNGGHLSERTLVILSYALCGFANFASIAIQIGGIGSLAPERQGDLARFGLRSIVGGSLAAFMTASIAGFLI